MKRLLFIVTACVLVGWGVGGVLGGCGGDDGATVAPPSGDDGGASGTSGGASGTSGGGTSGGTSGGTNGGGGGDDAGLEGGASSGGASNPGKISCGASECTVGTQICCQAFGDAGCIAENANCFGIEVECDETADCPDGQRCCLGNSGSGRARCRNNCTGGEIRLCKTNAECGNAGCTAKTCRGRTFQTCEPLPDFCNDDD